MTATETHTDTAADIDDDVNVAGDGLYQLIASNDHKAIGRLWIGLSVLFFIGFAILGAVVAMERVSLDGFSIFGGAAGYQQAWALVRTSGIVLVALPLLIGIATAMVPLQIGSPSIAFPRLAAASFWAWLVGAGLHVASFVADGGLGPAAFTRTDSTLLTLTSLGLMVVALLAASVCIATTVIALRPAGMTLLRVPAFSWSMLVATSVWILSLPVLLANLVYAWADLQGRDPIFFGNPDRIWGDIEWAFQQPQIYSLAIPILGIAAEVTPVAAKVRPVARSAVLIMIGVYGALSFGAWAQHAFSRGADPQFVDGKFIYEEPLYIIVGIAILLPILGVIGGMADTVRRGGGLPKMSAALAGSVAALLMLLAAAFIGGLRVLPFTHILFEENSDGINEMLSSAGAQYFLVIGAVVVSAIAALVWWAPKLFGGYATEGVASMAILAIFGGSFAVGMADFITSFIGQRDLSISSDVEDGVEDLNLLAMIGMGAIAMGGLAALVALINAIRSDEILPDDPFDGHTLEWASPSPPPVGNFVEPIGPIRSESPLLDEFEEVS